MTQDAAKRAEAEEAVAEFFGVHVRHIREAPKWCGDGYDGSCLRGECEVVQTVDLLIKFVDAAVAEAVKDYKYTIEQAERIIGDLRKPVVETVKEREAAILRAYHVTLDSLGAPADEWPCNRAKKLADEARREGAQMERNEGQVRLANAVEKAQREERERCDWLRPLKT